MMRDVVVVVTWHKQHGVMHSNIPLRVEVKNICMRHLN